MSDITYSQNEVLHMMSGNEKRIAELEAQVAALEAPPWVDVDILPEVPHTINGPGLARNVAYLHSTGYCDTNNIYYLVDGSAKEHGYTHYMVLPPAPKQP